MLSRKAKAAFYTCAGPLMKISGALYRGFKAPRQGLVKVHLGPGQEHYLNGWINVDANIITAKCEVWADLNHALPFHDNTVAAFYSHHVIEHLTNLRAHLAEVYRCLKPGGIYRLAGPNGDAAMNRYLANDEVWFDDFPDKRRSMGGKLENFLFCRGEHLTILTFSMLEEFLVDAGFTNIQHYLPVKETGCPGLFSDCLAGEYESDFTWPHTLVIEASKKPVI